MYFRLRSQNHLIVRPFSFKIFAIVYSLAKTVFYLDKNTSASMLLVYATNQAYRKQRRHHIDQKWLPIVQYTDKHRFDTFDTHIVLYALLSDSLSVLTEKVVVCSMHFERMQLLAGQFNNLVYVANQGFSFETKHSSYSSVLISV